MRLAEPGWLVLLALAAVPWLLGRARRRITWPTLSGFGAPSRLASLVRGGLPLLLRSLAIACIVVAIARPQSVAGRTRIAGQGVAIVVALDQSSSMATPDDPSSLNPYPPSRLDAAKATIAEFAAGRPDDLVGLVVFANLPHTACPPTLDHGYLVDAVQAVRTARPGDDGTNLGDALFWSIDLLHDSAPPRKVLVLVTDGRDSPAIPRPSDHPRKAARVARDLGITVHTIAVGRAGMVIREVDPRTKLGPATGVEGPDVELLEQIATLGGGRMFAAADAASLRQVFRTIDALEKSPIRGEIRTRYREWFAPLAGLALGLLLLDRTLATGRWRRLP